MENIYHIYVGGNFQKTDDLLTVRNPFNNKKVADTFRAGETILEEAILKALAVQDELGELPSWQRHKFSLYIAALLEEAKIVPAIAAGCPIILKPSSSTLLSTLALAGVIVTPTADIEDAVANGADLLCGGIKDSGLGREGVKYSIHDMLEPKLLIKSI